MKVRPVLLITKVDSNAPRDGGTMRTDAMVRALRGAGIPIHVIAIRHPRQPGSLSTKDVLRAGLAYIRVVLSWLRRPSVLVLKWLSFGKVIEIQRYLQVNSQTFVIIDHAELGVYCPMLPGDWILSTQNLENELVLHYARSRRGLIGVLLQVEARLMRRFEMQLVRKAEMVVAVSERDLAVMRTWSARVTLLLAPNGVSHEGFDTERSLGRTVVFVAHLGWRPNVDAAMWLAKDVWPYVVKLSPSLKLQIIGRTPTLEVQRLDGGSISVIPDVESVAPYLASAAVATAPLLAAGGTRLKILEALSFGVPVVSTRLGAMGLEHMPREVVAVADHDEDFARELVRLAGVGEHHDLSGACREAVANYRWETTTARFVEYMRSRLTVE